MKLESKTLSLEDLLLDPNNYRFLDDNPGPRVSDKRFTEQTVQDNALRRLRADNGFQPLKDSILSNGFLPSEPLVVRSFGDGKFLVVDGNRRVAAVKTLVEEYNNGAGSDKGIIASLATLPTVIASIDEAETASYEVLMGVRHLSGIKRWGGYAEARLINDLAENTSAKVSEVAERIGLDAQEINRRRRAYRATEEFRNHEDFKKSFKTDMYALFHEAVGIPAIREKYKWNNETMKFEDPQAAASFFAFLVPHTEDGKTYDAKLRTYGDVRKFGKHIVTSPDLIALLEQPEPTLDGIIANIERDKDEKEWSNKVKKLLKALNQIPALAVSKATPDEKALLQEAKESIETLIKSTDVGKTG